MKTVCPWTTEYKVYYKNNQEHELFIYSLMKNMRRRRIGDKCTIEITILEFRNSLLFYDIIYKARI